MNVIYWAKTLSSLVFVFLLSGVVLRADETVIVRSGNGSLGSQDTQVRVLRFGRQGLITPTTSDFITAQTAQFAWIEPACCGYVFPLPSDPTAQWVGTTPGFNPESALYAIPFQITDTVIASATLDLPYSVDNAINGIYINGSPISGNSFDGDYHSEYRFIRTDVAPLLKPNSTNWLYLNVYDFGGISALIFRATITVNGAVQGAQSISPDHGGNTGNVSVRVIGTNFTPGTQVKLTGSGSDIIGTNTTVLTSNILTSTLVLTNALPGSRTVLIVSPDGTSVPVPGDFTVEQGGAPDLRIQKIATPAVLGRNETYFITVSNVGTVDSGMVPVIEDLDPWFTFVAANPVPDAVRQAPKAFPPGTGGSYDAFVEWDLPSIAAGGSQLLTYTVALDSSFPVSKTVIGPACIEITRAACEVAEVACFSAAAFACVQEGPEACEELVESCHAPFAACLLGAGAICTTVGTGVRGSVDPNDLIGPAGTGIQRWIRGDQPVQYATLFENLPTATKPATDVILTDNLSSETLDLTTLSVGLISFGNSVYTPVNAPLMAAPFTANIDLRPNRDLIVRINAALNPATGQVTIKFLSIDPATGLPPIDPLVGFLPPGIDGSVLFTIMPKPDLATGTVIQNQATVVFDANPPINTPTWSNTIDNTKPVSSVSALQASQISSTFAVQWAGSDSDSGIKDFSIYVSDSGGSFTPWLTNTTATQADYVGTRFPMDRMIWQAESRNSIPATRMLRGSMRTA
jgi:Domain of unknown function DUF11